VRSALEGLAAATLCKRKNRKAVVRQLQAALDALAAATGSINDMVEIDLDFHRTMCALTGNASLVRSWEGLAGSIRMSIMFAGADRAVANMSVPRHQALVDAVAAGDPDRARIAVEDHMHSAAMNLVTQVEAAEPDSA
jgi:DNA-binding FadR family transcriptional regulator